MNIQVWDIKDPNTPINASVFDATTSIMSDKRRQLAMLLWEGMYWLVPIEILWECGLLQRHRDKHEDSYNILKPVCIMVEQCIPIPSETAKILMGL